VEHYVKIGWIYNGTGWLLLILSVLLPLMVHSDTAYAVSFTGMGAAIALFIVGVVQFVIGGKEINKQLSALTELKQQMAELRQKL